MKSFPHNLYHIHMELARESGHPHGDVRHGYDLVVPLTPDHHLDAETWRSHRILCRVRHFRPDQSDKVGRLARKPGGTWYFDYFAGEADDEPGFHLDERLIQPGEYVSIREDDDEMHTFRIISVEPVLGTSDTYA